MVTRFQKQKEIKVVAHKPIRTAIIIKANEASAGHKVYQQATHSQ